MIFVDANYVLRYLVRPATPQDRAMSASAAILFRLVEAGEATFTTTDAVIAEVVFILTSRRHYRIPRGEAVARLRPILLLQGCKLPRKTLCLRALDLWAAAPRLSFVDALGAVHSQELGLMLASFDEDLARLPGLTRWQPPPDEQLGASQR